MNPHRVGPRHAAALLTGALGAEPFDEKLITGMNPHRVQSGSVGEAGAGTLGVESLDEEEQVELLGKWLLRDVKAAKPLLRKAGIEFVNF